MLRKFTVASLAAGLVLTTAALPATAQEPGPVEITLLHDSHFHGKFGDAEVPREACPGGAPSAGFVDISDTHRAAIDCAAELGVIKGTSSDPPRFSPLLSATREQVSSMVVGMLESAGVTLPEAEDPPPFDDLGATHGDNVARLHAAGIVQGRGDLFLSRAPVRRDQLASILIGALEFATGDTFTPDPEGARFPDVPESNVHSDNVHAARDLGLVQGRADGNYYPRRAVRRDQVASMTVGVLDHLAELDAMGLRNLGRYMALVEERKAARDGAAIYMGNGDDIAPSLLSGVFDPNGIHMIDALNQSPMDVNTFGNHEFDYGPANLRELLEASETPWVTANVRDIDTGDVFAEDLGVEEYILVDVEGVRVGITGLAPENMASITSLGDDTQQIPADEALDIVVPKMVAAGADLIVVTSHLCGTRARELADERVDIDVIAGDHCAEVLDEPYVSDTGVIVSLAGHEFNKLAELTLTVTPGVGGEAAGPSAAPAAVILDHEFTLHDLAADYPLIEPLAAVQEVVDQYNAELDEELNEVIGTRTVTWDTRVGVVRTSENAFGNFLTDEMRGFHNADIAVQNSGGIRADSIFPPGDITKREIAEILPFANHLVLAEIDGDAILEALEHSVRLYPNPNGGFLQVSGLEFTFDPAQPAGSRVVSVEIGGEPLDPDARYTMATNDFTLGGGDGYSMFADPARRDVLVDANEGPLLSTFLMDRIVQIGTVDTDVEDRITVMQ